jgi:hypothetical protein
MLRLSSKRKTYGKGPTRGSCSFGFIRRKSLTYRKKSGTVVRTKSTCILERGKRGSGRGSPRKMKVLSELKKGSLTSLGYGIREGVNSRRAALKIALKKYGYSSLIKKLNVLVVYNKNAHPDIAKVAHGDMMYVAKLDGRI